MSGTYKWPRPDVVAVSTVPDRPGVWLVASSLLLLSAGCAGPSDGVQGTSIEITNYPISETGIMGVVIDDSFSPIVGASVVLDGQTQTTSNDAGLFFFGPLEPGLYTVGATAPGFQATSMDATVLADKLTQMKIILVAGPAAAVYFETRIQTGTLACGGAFRLGSPSSSSTTICGNTFLVGVYLDQYLLGWNVGTLRGSDVVGFWGETMWTSSQALGSGMLMIWFVSSASPESSIVENRVAAIGSAEGTSRVSLPLTIDVALNATDQQPTGTGAIVCQEGECWLESGHYSAARTLGTGSAADVGFTVQQRYDDFLTIFHGGVLPELFTALPDA